MLAGETPQALGDAVHGRVEMAEALAGWTCRSPAARVPEAIALARELAGDGARILVVSDRKPPEPPMGRVVWRSFGDARPNVALVRAGRVAKDGVDRVTFEIANFSEGPRDARIVLSAGNQEVHTENLALARRETRRLAFRLRAGVGPIAAKLADADALPIDDACWLVAEETPPIRVDVRLADDALRKSVEAAFRAGGRTSPAGKSVHLVVADGPDWPDVPADAWIVQILAEKEAEAFLGPFVMDKTHPLTEGLGLDGVVWGAGKGHDLPGAPVLLAGNVPLASEVEMATGQRRLRMRLRHDLSTLTQAPAWPIWWWNAAQWRASAMPGLRRGNVRLGEPAVLRTPPGVEQVTVHGPGGTSTLPVRAQRAVVPAPDVGLYEIVQGDETIPFAVNAVNAEESDLSTCESGAWGEWPDDGAATPGMRGVAWLLMLLALAVMAWHLHLVRQGAE